MSANPAEQPGGLEGHPLHCIGDIDLDFEFHEPPTVRVPSIDQDIERRDWLRTVGLNQTVILTWGEIVVRDTFVVERQTPFTAALKRLQLEVQDDPEGAVVWNRAFRNLTAGSISPELGKHLAPRQTEE